MWRKSLALVIEHISSQNIFSTVRFKNFRVQTFRLTTFEIFKVHDLYRGVKTFEVFDILESFMKLQLFSRSEFKSKFEIFHIVINVGQDFFLCGIDFFSLEMKVFKNLESLKPHCTVDTNEQSVPQKVLIRSWMPYFLKKSSSWKLIVALFNPFSSIFYLPSLKSYVNQLWYTEIALVEV